MNFGEVFNKIKSKVIKGVATVLSNKKSMKIKLGVNFEIAYINTDPFQDDNNKRADGVSTTNEIITWSTNPDTCTKANINTLIDSNIIS